MTTSEPVTPNDARDASDRVETLDWDSEFFGIPIGRADLAGTTPELLDGIDAEARRRGLACLYASLDPVVASTTFLVQEHGWRMVEVAMMLDRPGWIPVYRPETESEVRVGTPDDVPALAGAIDQLAPWSRFAVDPRFGLDAARRMHLAWVERAASGVEGRFLHIAEDGLGISGFCTGRWVDRPHIDLIATTRPAKGAAERLVAHLQDQVDGVNWLGGPIAARNVASLRFCEHAGLRIVGSTYHYHRWLDEEGTPR
jgi:hypothetical protein